MKKIFSLFFLCLCLSVTGDEIDTWSSPPETISTLGVDSSDPVVGMDADGNVVAIWLEDDVIKAKTKLLGMSWSSASTVSSTGASEPHLVVDPAGNAVALWLESGVVKAATLPFGSTWSSADTLSSSGSSSPQLAGDPDGNAVAVWLTSDVVLSKTKLFGMSWSVLADTLSTSDSAAPQVAIGADGTVVAAWHTLNGITTLYNINSATKSISGLWSVASTVSDPAKNSVYPQVAVDTNGNSDAVWYTYELTGVDYSNVILQSSYHPVAGSWSTPADVSDPGARNPAGLMATVKFNEAGKAIAMWTNSINGQTFDLSSATTDLNFDWTLPALIVDNLYTYTFDLAINAIADAFTIFMAYDSSASSVVINAAESNVGGFQTGFWNTAVTLSLGTENGYPRNAAVIVGSDCYGVAVWVNNNGSNNIIKTSFGTGTAVEPPSNLAVDQQTNDFGVFTEFYNVLSWTASSDPNLNGYIIYRNGHFLTFIEGTTMPLQIIDSNRVENEPVTYGVSTIDTSGSESAIITVDFP